MQSFNLCELDKIKIHGRVNVQKPYTFFWTDSGIELNVAASALRLKIKCSYQSFEPWITVEINGAFISRIRMENGVNDVCIFRNMDKNKIKNVKILRDTQPFSGENDELTFLSIETDGEFSNVDEKPVQLEIYGDSITSGEGTVGSRNDYDFISMYISGQNTYPRMMAKSMNADISVVSQCGWGVISSWDNNPSCSVPKIFDYVCGAASKSGEISSLAFEPYDFTAFSPNAVIINLGTNDNTAFNMKPFTLSGGNTFSQDKDNEKDVERFENAVIDFIAAIREKRQNAVIVWAFGIIKCPFAEQLIQSAVEKYKAKTKDEKVYYLPLTPMTDDQFGSRSHPGISAHEQMAKELEAFLCDKLG